MSELRGDKDRWRRVAVLVAGLDAATADLLLDQLSAEQAGRIRQAVMELGEVDSQEENRILDAFRVARNSVSRDKQETAPPATPTSRGASKPAIDLSGERPFEFLEDATPATLSQLLYREHPQTVAVVLAHLPADVAAQVIRHWPDRLQADVLTRVAHLDEMHPQALASLEDAVYGLLAGSVRPRRARAAGVTAVESIVAELAPTTQTGLLAQIAQRDGELAQIIQATTDEQAGDIDLGLAGANREGVTGDGVGHAVSEALAMSEPVVRLPHVEFGDLEWLSATEWARLLKAVDSETMFLALAGAAPSLLEALMRLAPPPLARNLQKKLTRLGPLQLDDIDRAQACIAHSAAELILAGELEPLEPRHFAAAI